MAPLPYKVLVVDDDPDALNATARILRPYGEVLKAGSGEDALDQIRRQRPDLVMLDVVLPDIDGQEVLRRIRSDPETRYTAVIMLSSLRTAPEHVAAGLDTGADGYIERPVTSTELLARVNAVMRRGEELTQARQAGKRFEALIAAQPDSVMVVSQDGLIRFANDATEAFFNRRMADLLGAPFGSPLEGDDPSEVEVRSAEGVERVAEMGIKPIEWADEPAFLVTLHEVTARRKAEGNLQMAASVFSHAQEAILITDANAAILDVNDAFARITGFTRDQVVGRNPKLLASGRHDRAFYQAMWSDLETRGFWSGEIWNRRSMGDVYAEYLTIVAVPGANGKTLNYIGFFSDITEDKAHQQELEYIARYDPLTGIPNRSLLLDRLSQSIRQAERRGTLIAVCYIDLDGFKEVNDSHGHEAGDALLIDVSRRFKARLRDGDTLGRLGGDEFVVIVSDIRQPVECNPILGRLLEACAEPFVVMDDYLMNVTASIGVTFCPLNESEPDQLLRQADQAMYHAKLAGKNRYQFFDPEQDRIAQSRRENLNRVALGLSSGEFTLHYQPVVNMRTGDLVAVEALVRWQHPEKGLLMPDAFLPLIENTELGITLGRFVLDSALGQLAKWHAGGHTHRMCINVAAVELQDKGFVENLKAQLAHHETVSPESLEFEILETAALNDVDRASAVISDCLDLGVRFSLDDFGTGYSSLEYLKRLPSSTLKIDKGFVIEMLWNAEDLAIAEGIIGLALAFRRDVIGEGVESDEHAEILLKLGCEIGQGYGIARPMPADALDRWLRESPWQPPQHVNEDTVASRELLPMVYAEVDHRHWVHWLGETITGSASQPPPMDRSRCRFGEWYDNAGARYFGHIPEFRDVAAVHHGVHARAAEAIAAHVKGDRTVADAALAEVRTLSDDLVNRLHHLYRQLSTMEFYPRT